MRLDDYKKYLDRRDYRGIINELIKEYYSYGMELGYVDLSNSNKLKVFLREANFIFDLSLKDSVRIQGKTIRINPNNVFRTDCSIEDSEENASRIIYTELSHCMNSFHSDYLAGPRGLFYIFCNDFHRFVMDNYNVYFYKKNDGKDISSLDHYPIYAVKLLDDVVSQNVSEELLAYKYGYDRGTKYKDLDYDYGISYKTNFGSDGLFQDIGEKFSKTIGYESLNKLSNLSFHGDVCLDILCERLKNRDSVVNLYRELCFMGLLLYTDYYKKGRIKNDLPDSSLIENSYLEAIHYLEQDIENRKDTDAAVLNIDKWLRKINILK